MLVVCHSFEEPHQESITVTIPEGFEVVDEFANESISIDGTTVIVKPMNALSGCAVYAVKR